MYSSKGNADVRPDVKYPHWLLHVSISLCLDIATKCKTSLTDPSMASAEPAHEHAETF